MSVYLVKSELIANNPIFWDLPMFVDTPDTPEYPAFVAWDFEGLGRLARAIPRMEDESLESAKEMAASIIAEAKAAVDLRKAERAPK